jgi:hypothetical protein
VRLIALNPVGQREVRLQHTGPVSQSSLRIVRWPIIALNRTTSSSWAVGWRALRFACPPELLTHSESVAAVTRSSRQRPSSCPPRSSLSTAAIFRFAEKRPRSGRAALGSPVALRLPSEAIEPVFVVMDALLLNGACCPNRCPTEP